MISDGLIEEVNSLYPDGLGKTARAAIGYKELFSYFEGDMSKEEAIEKGLFHVIGKEMDDT